MAIARANGFLPTVLGAQVSLQNILVTSHVSVHASLLFSRVLGCHSTPTLGSAQSL